MSTSWWCLSECCCASILLRGPLSSREVRQTRRALLTSFLGSMSTTNIALGVQNEHKSKVRGFFLWIPLPLPKFHFIYSWWIRIRATCSDLDKNSCVASVLSLRMAQYWHGKGTSHLTYMIISVIWCRGFRTWPPFKMSQLLNFSGPYPTWS